jgi:hypothetical protein
VTYLELIRELDKDSDVTVSLSLDAEAEAISLEDLARDIVDMMTAPGEDLSHEDL